MRSMTEAVAGRVAEATDVLVEAFADYPVMRWVLGAPGDGYPARLRTLVGFFVQARALRSEPVLGIADGTGLAAAALVSYPGRRENPPELYELRDRVWRDLGDSARERYEAFSAACAPLIVDGPHIHLNMIGVRSSARGRGLGRQLIERVHAMSKADPGSTGVTLTTEDPTNVPLYEHLGYRVLGHAVVAHGLETWAFFRPDGP